MNNPQLLKARQYHSRIFAVAVVLLLLVSKPYFAPGNFIHTLFLWLGYTLVIFGAFGRVYCSAFIGGRKNDEVVRSGPFSVVRNPLYVFSFIATVGVGMQSGMLIILVILVSAFVLYYPMVVAKEEAFLENKFGEAYVKYKREVPRWKPDMGLWSEPEQIDAKPKFLRHTMLDAAIFFLPLPCFIIINTLQVNEILPSWLTLL